MHSAAASARFELDTGAQAWPAPAVGGVPTAELRRIDPDEARCAEWAELTGHASEPNAFAEPWFMAPSLRHLAAGRDVRILEVRSGARLIGLMPLVIASRYGRMPVRHVQNWQHYHSFLGTPLVRAGHEQIFWSAVLATLDEEPWAQAFLHVANLVEHGPVHRGLAAAAWVAGRSCDTVFRSDRALLCGPLSPTDYYETHVRKKKRKELKRLRARLSEMGSLEFRTLRSAGELAAWCDAFLALERAGWKGRNGSALGCSATLASFFREVVTGAFEADRLDLLRLDLDGRPIAMLVNFLTAPGSFSFKIAFDEEFARFSPGVLLQIENLRLLDSQDIEWMDSCAVEDHSMINSLWADRRTLVRVTVPLAGVRRNALFRLCRRAELLSAAWRSRRPTPPSLQEEDDD